MQRIELRSWRFQILRLQTDKKITLPHTWNVDEDEKVQLYKGKALYTTTVTLEDPADQTGVLYFGCAYHTARVWVNGTPAGTHSGSGYTPFQLDVTRHLTRGKNTIQVEVDNRKSKNMLPYRHHFDWADDGGLTRDAALLLYAPTDLRDLRLAYTITQIQGDRCSGWLELNITGPPQPVTIEVAEAATGRVVLTRAATAGRWSTAALRWHRLLRHCPDCKCICPGPGWSWATPKRRSRSCWQTAGCS